MVPDNIDLRKLRALQMVAEHGSLRRAAVRLGVTVSAVSFSLKRLEADLGIELFRRYPNRLVLTPAGETLAIATEAVFRGLENALDALSLTSSPASRLNISISNDLSWYLAPHFGSFVRLFPQVALNVSVHRSEDALALVASGDLDLAIGRFPAADALRPADGYKSLAIEPIVHTGFTLVQNPNTAGTRFGRRPGTDDLARLTLIMLPQRSTARRMIDSVFAQAGLRPHACIEVGNCQLIREYALRGIGSGLIHTICGDRCSDGLVSIDLMHPFGKMTFSAAYRRASLTATSPSVMGMMEILERQEAAPK